MIWLVFILLEIARNYYIIEIQKAQPNYLQSFLIRGIIAILHGASLGCQSWGEYLPIFILQVTSFWILFDIGLNFARKKPLTHKGENSGWLDKLPTKLYWFLKILGTIIAILLLLKLF